MSNKESAFAYMNLGHNILVSQEALNRENSAKASQLLRYSGLLIGLLLATLELGGTRSCAANYYFELAYMQGIPFIGVAISSIAALITVHWQSFPDMEYVAEILYEWPTEKIYKRLGDTYKTMVAINYVHLSRGAWLTAIATIFLLYQIVGLLAIFILSSEIDCP